MIVSPHFTRPSADSLRAFAEGRRRVAELFSQDSDEHLSQAKSLDAQGKDKAADMQRRLARVKESSAKAALTAAESAEARANELDGVKDPQEAAG